MFAASERWQTGVRLWRVEHDNQKGVRDLDKSGSLPEYFEEVVAQYSDEQDREDAAKKEVDFYFEIPLLCAKRIVGFKHDESNTELADDRYEVLAPLAGEKRWWQWWR